MIDVTLHRTRGRITHPAAQVEHLEVRDLKSYLAAPSGYTASSANVVSGHDETWRSFSDGNGNYLIGWYKDNTTSTLYSITQAYVPEPTPENPNPEPSPDGNGDPPSTPPSDPDPGPAGPAVSIGVLDQFDSSTGIIYTLVNDVDIWYSYGYKGTDTYTVFYDGAHDYVAYSIFKGEWDDPNA